MNPPWPLPQCPPPVPALLISYPWLPSVMGWDLKIVSAHKLFPFQVVLIMVLHRSNRTLTEKEAPSGAIKMYPE